MEMIKASKKDFTAVEIFNFTRNPEMELVKNCTGDVFTVNDFVEYHDVNGQGEEVDILVIRSGDRYISTISETFKDEFFRILDIVAQAGGGTPEIGIVQGESKKGRTFYTCKLVDLYTPEQ